MKTIIIINKQTFFLFYFIAISDHSWCTKKIRMNNLENLLRLSLVSSISESQLNYIFNKLAKNLNVLSKIEQFATKSGLNTLVYECPPSCLPPSWWSRLALLMSSASVHFETKWDFETQSNRQTAETTLNGHFQVKILECNIQLTILH